jgi:hypothetical protein
VIGKFTEKIGLKKYTLYVQDYCGRLKLCLAIAGKEKS